VRLALLLLGCLTLLSAAAESQRGREFYVVQFAPGPNWSEATQYEKQPEIDDHIAYWQSLYYREVLLMSGPWQDQSGGIFIVRADNREMVNAIVAQDPGVLSGLITSSVKEWRVLSSAMRSVRPERIEINADESFRLERLDPGSPLNLRSKQN
jgi:uncharacterized protein YciI